MVDKFTKPPYGEKLVEKINEIIDDKQDTLVSGTNIKTINNMSLLGSGNIDIQGGGGSYTDGTGINITDNIINIIQTEGLYNYIPYGNIEEEGGILSGFSTTNYATPDENFNPQTNAWSIIIKVNLNSNAGIQCLLGTNIGLNYNGLAWILINGKQSVYLSNNRNAWNIGNVLGSLSFATDIDYYLKAEFTGTQYNLYYSFDGTNWNLDASLTTSSEITFGDNTNISLGFNNYGNGYQYLDGSIDLHGCSFDTGIKQWNGSSSKSVAKATSELYGLVKPDNSSITVNNGVLSASVFDLTAGTGIDITDSTISIDDSVVPLLSDLATVATSGSYNDLSDKPTIPAAQVNSDWNATSGVAQILNKPTLATVATSGSYNDLSNKPTIPSEVTESTVSGWGFTKNTGTVTSVNNVSPVNGNVTLNIPTVNNATLTIQKNGSNVATFTANSSTNQTANITVPTATSDLTNDSGYITSSALPTKTSDLTNDSGFITSASLPTVNNATLTIQKNGTAVDTFTANASADKIINITVPTTASDVSALPSSTKYGATIDVTLSTTDYKQTITLKDQDGNTLNTKIVDFPVESMVVSGTFDSTNKKIVLTLQNGNTTDIPVGDLISGLQTEITSTNKLSADLIADGTTNKTVTASEKTTWNNKQNALTSTQINNIAKGGTALQPNDNVSELNNDAGYITNSALNGYATETYVDTGLATKQATLVSGTNIKTVNGNSLLGEGDLTIQSGASYSATCPAITPVDGVASWVVTHNLDTQAVVTALYSNGNKIEHNTLVTSNNAITVTFKASSTVTAGDYKIVVLASGGSGGGSADDTYTNNTINVDIIGSLANNQGVLSGFTNNTNYGQLPTTITLGNDFDIVFKVKTASDFSIQPTIAAAYNQIALAVLVNNSNKLQISTGNGSSWGDILASNTTISTNTDYKFKFSLHNSTLSIYIADGNGEFILDNSIASNASIPNATIVLGVTRMLMSAWDGTIDLKESYININGTRAWTGADYSELTNLSPVTDYYISGSSWYKETFSDATRTKRIWLEQGGRTSLLADYTTATVTLLKAFSNTDYAITCAAMMPSTGDDGTWNNANVVRYATLAPSSFEIYSRGAEDGGRYINWVATGV